jgi:Tol biopolymer transport system component
MLSRAVAVVAMAVFGVVVYAGLGSLKSKAASKATVPTASSTRVELPGTLFVAQAGALYKLQNGVFTKLATGQGGSWMQPVLTPDHSHLVAVDRQAEYSDLYLLDLSGHVVRQLTDDSGPHGSLQHWAFYPRVSADGSTLYYSYDAPKYPNDYRVDLAIWAQALSSGQRYARRQSTFNDYTGGDTFPIPTGAGGTAAGTSGGLLYSKYDIGADGPFSQLWYQARTLSVGEALTQPTDDCGQPALSPDGGEVAMVCTGARQTGQLEVASFDPQAGLGTPRTLAQGILGSPAWSPDGHTLAYLAAAGSSRHFQLWTVPVPAASASPAPALSRQLTTDLDFDATSPPAWM